MLCCGTDKFDNNLENDRQEFPQVHTSKGLTGDIN